MANFQEILKLSVHKVKPIFLFSLPRSGSTLLQRLLGAHEKISTTSEPWVLLPMLYAIRTDGIYTEYWQKTSVLALEDFLDKLPKGKIDYYGALRQFVLHLYTKASDEGAAYFLDKTPRNHLIADEIHEIFPDGKFIFLWRNPLSVIASIMQSFAGGRWNLHYFKIDLFAGLENLLHTYQNNKTSFLSITYEGLIESPINEINRILDYLGLEGGDQIDLSKTNLSGRMGDHAGTEAYSRISLGSLDKWKEVICNPIRRRWCRKYLYKIGREHWKMIGYDLEDLITQLDSVPMSTRFLLSDMGRVVYGALLPFFCPRSMKEKVAKIPDFSKIYPSY